MLLPLLAAAANLADFEAVLNAQNSATVALRQWCELRHIAAPAEIRAQRQSFQNIAPPANIRRHLHLRGDDQFAFRHVTLTCGDTVMSEAYNWYVPSRLTAEMNARLNSGQTPFGTVVAPLQFRRERLPAAALRGSYCPAGAILANRARLVLPGGQPLALLIECYTPANLTAGN